MAEIGDFRIVSYGPGFWHVQKYNQTPITRDTFANGWHQQGDTFETEAYAMAFYRFLSGNPIIIKDLKNELRS